MPPMPTYYVGKGTQFGVLDMFDGRSETVELYRDTIAKLNSSTTLLQLAEDRKDAGGTDLTDTDIRHFDKDWLGGWWTDQHVAKVLRNGIRKAVEVALYQNPDDANSEERDPPLPIEAFWVCADEQVFHVYVNQGPHQVTVIVYTPPPGRYVARADFLEENIWVVKTRDDFDGAYPNETIRRLTPEEDWPVLIERRLSYVEQASE